MLQIFPVSVPLSTLQKCGRNFDSFRYFKYFFPVTSGSEFEKQRKRKSIL